MAVPKIAQLLVVLNREKSYNIEKAIEVYNYDSTKSNHFMFI